VAGILRAIHEAALYTREGLDQRGQRAAVRALLVSAVGTPVLAATIAILGGDDGRGTVAIGILGPILLGIGVGLAMPGVGGWVFGLVGAALGALPVGVAMLVVGSVMPPLADEPVAAAAQAVVSVIGVALLLAFLMAAQLGLGVVVGSIVAGVRRRCG
jgi:hypothetical protein